MVYLNHQKNRGADHPEEGGSRKENDYEVMEKRRIVFLQREYPRFFQDMEMWRVIIDIECKPETKIKLNPQAHGKPWHKAIEEIVNNDPSVGYTYEMLNDGLCMISELE